MPQLITISNPCPKCRAEFEAQRTEYCREFLRYQRENFSQRTEINALEVQLKHSLEKLLKAERELIQLWKTSQQKAELVAWGMLQKDGFILDVISPEEHERYEGEYTIPLFTLQKAEPVAWPMEEQPDGAVIPVDPADMAPPQQQVEPVAYFDFQEHKFSWAKHVKIGPVPMSIKVEPMKLYSEAPKCSQA